jgi:hypothetical protein
MVSTLPQHSQLGLGCIQDLKAFLFVQTKYSNLEGRFLSIGVEGRKSE